MHKIALVVNEPPPYRIPVFNRIAATPGINLQVIFCCRREPNRHWDLPPIEFNAVYLHERVTTVRGRYIHNNPDVLVALNRFQPDVVVGNGFNPTHLYAMAWCALRRRPYVPMTDGTLRSEQVLSRLHSAIRRTVYRRARAFIAASEGGVALYGSYGIPRWRCHLSCLCIDNQRFRPVPGSAAPTRDFLFCGRLEPGKQPGFAIEVAALCARLLGRKTRMLLVGSGSLEQELRQLAERLASDVDVQFNGFAAQAELPALYQSARLFLFPTRADVWGVVANEACAAGLPVLVTPDAGVAGELVADGLNGYVRPADRHAWAVLAAGLLADDSLREAFAQQSLRMVEPYCFERAAQGVLDACAAALDPRSDTYTAVRRPV